MNRYLEHVGHNVELVYYGKDEPLNISLECIDCFEVVWSEDIDETV